MSSADYQIFKATDICRAALRIGALKKAGNKWLCDRRAFDSKTITALIESGEAVRIEDRVFARDLLREAIG